MPIENAAKPKNSVTVEEAVEKKDTKSSKVVSQKKTEDAPPPRGEQAP